jgi:hypothetical protein
MTTSEELLGLPVAVAVGGVEVVDAGVDRGVDDASRRRLVDPHAEVVAPDAGDRHLEVAHPALLHGTSPPGSIVGVRPTYRRSRRPHLGSLDRTDGTGRTAGREQVHDRATRPATRPTTRPVTTSAGTLHASAGESAAARET